MNGVYFVSLGCPKNLVDSQVMLGQFKQQADRFTLSQNPHDAEVIIVNTCSFIQAAKEESIETILEMADYKNQGKCKVLVVSGCLAQRYSKELEKEFPEVDLFIGTGEYHRIVELLDKLEAQIKNGHLLEERSYVNQPAFIHTEKDERLLTGSPFSAYLKISEGCNRRCSFCIIPTLRGNVRSRSVESLVTEAKKMAAQGVKELNLVAQDLTEYGMEWKYKENLEMLLPQLTKIDGIKWIRLHYIYPDQFSDQLIDIIAREDKIVKYLDMPIQHTNDRVLTRMNRRLTKERLFALVDKLRTKIPDIVFRTSIIVGFPGETEEEFEELCQDLKRLRLDYVGVFEYSNEEGTKASRFEEQLPSKIRKDRKRKLIKILQEQKLLNHKKMIGREFLVLVEGESEESEHLMQGRLSTQAQEIDDQVLINDFEVLDGSQIVPGSFLRVKITDTIPGYLLGTATKLVS